MLRLEGTKSIEEMMTAGERVYLDSEYIEAVCEIMPDVSLHTRLQAMALKGEVERTPSLYLSGGKAWSVNGEKLEIVAGFRGKSSWSVNGRDNYDFRGPHDLAVDTTTGAVVAFARC